MTFQKKLEPQCKKKKISSQSKPCELHEECSSSEINCSLWRYRGVSNKGKKANLNHVYVYVSGILINSEKSLYIWKRDVIKRHHCGH